MLHTMAHCQARQPMLISGVCSVPPPDLPPPNWPPPDFPPPRCAAVQAGGIALHEVQRSIYESRHGSLPCTASAPGLNAYHADPCCMQLPTSRSAAPRLPATKVSCCAWQVLQLFLTQRSLKMPRTMARCHAQQFMMIPGACSVPPPDSPPPDMPAPAFPPPRCYVSCC